MTKEVSPRAEPAVTSWMRVTLTRRQKQVRAFWSWTTAAAPIGIVSCGAIALHLRREQSGQVLKRVSQPS